MLVTLGFLGRRRVGVLIGAVTTCWAANLRRQGWAVIVAVSVWGAAIPLFGLVDTLWVGLVLLAVAGWADVIISAVLRNTILQRSVPERFRSRMSSIQMAVVQGYVWVTWSRCSWPRWTSVEVSVISGGLACIVGAPPLRRAGCLRFSSPRGGRGRRRARIIHSRAAPSLRRRGARALPGLRTHRRGLPDRPTPPWRGPPHRQLPGHDRHHRARWAPARLPRGAVGLGRPRWLRGRRGRGGGPAGRGRRRPWRRGPSVGTPIRWLDFSDHQYLRPRPSLSEAGRSWCRLGATIAESIPPQSSSPWAATPTT